MCIRDRAYITHTYWDDDSDKLAFNNGVLEISTGEFLDHSHEHYLTWGLDFDYDPYAESGPIIDWLRRTQYGDENRLQVLRAWLKACLVGQGHELQRFLEVIGPGGRGKSTFANLCCALVGTGNYASTTLNQLEQSRFEVASIKSKRQTQINLNNMNLKEKIITEIKKIYDPEIPVNIYELGLIYDIKVESENLVKVKMTLTTPNCPVAESLPKQVKEYILKVKGVSDVKLNLVWDPPWDKSKMSEAAKLELNL